MGTVASNSSGTRRVLSEIVYVIYDEAMKFQALEYSRTEKWVMDSGI